MKDNSLAVFEDYKIRRVYDEESETWYFSVVDIIQVLIQQPDYQAARNYWKVLKNRLNKEGSETVTKCNRLKMEASDGKQYLTDVADPETLLEGGYFLVYRFDQFLFTPISFKDSSMLKISSMFSAKSITAKSPDNGNVSQLKGNTEFNFLPS